MHNIFNTPGHNWGQLETKKEQGLQEEKARVSINVISKRLARNNSSATDRKEQQKIYARIPPTPLDSLPPPHSDTNSLVAGSVEGDAHKNTTDETGDGDGHDPGEEQEADTLPVDGFEGAVAEAHADRRAGDAHRGRHGQLVLREDQDGDGRAHFHGRAAGGGVVGDLVAHD